MESGKRDRDMEVQTTHRKPRVLLAASGSVAAIKFGNLCHCFREWAEVRAVVSKSSLPFLDRLSLPREGAGTRSIAGGLCDNLLTCIIRAWDYSKPLFVAPAMNTLMWNSPFTERHLLTLDELGVTLIPPIKKRLACGDYGNGAMAEPSLIYSTVRLFWESQAHQQSAGTS
ncbi:unnamed protein product [Brassica oleracea var. botrytis]|uniref:Uncharacterized protein n=2 Tax=Brassica TaxID=3705 RepID=A0A0D3CJ36_BRAOL|nr:hypothetical protein HID58_067893 [Brassica napus]CAF1933426.1 unnamed protein product [Brassica napus]